MIPSRKFNVSQVTLETAEMHEIPPWKQLKKRQLIITGNHKIYFIFPTYHGEEKEEEGWKEIPVEMAWKHLM